MCKFFKKSIKKHLLIFEKELQFICNIKDDLIEGEEYLWKGIFLMT